MTFKDFRIKFHSRTKVLLKSPFFYLFLSFLSVTLPENLYSQDENNPEFDEVSVFVSVPKVGGSDIGALIKDDMLYLSVIDLFSFLKIKNNASSGYDTVAGFFITEQSSYLIDRVNSRIVYKGKSYEVRKGDIIRTDIGLYLKYTYFGDVFELPCIFNFRSLTVTINPKMELPYIREMRLEQMRSNLNQLKGDIKADTTIKSSHPFFQMGMADWTFLTSQQSNTKPNTRLGLNIGSVVAGGETNVNLNIDGAQKFSLDDQFYMWRYVNNKFRPFKQVFVGKFATDLITSLNSALLGVKITNTPTTYRGTYGIYKLSDFTEPGWTVELYVNNVLIDYKKSDASGFFSFDVPLVYGTTFVKLQFYGPWGEERSKEQNIMIPFNFLPKGIFEYSLTSGISTDTSRYKIGRFDFNYGLNRNISIGAGVEYSSKLQTQRSLMPFVNGSFRLFNSMLVSGEYIHGIKYSGIFSFQLPSEIQFELDYSKYNRAQKVINTPYLQEAKASVVLPVKTKLMTLFTRMSYNQYQLPLSKYSSAELLLSGTLLGVNANITTTALITKNSKPSTNSNFALTFSLPYSFIISPQAQYDYNKSELVFAKTSIEKMVFKNGYLSMSYERNFRNNYTNIEAGLRIDFNFAQMILAARKSNNQIVYTESASGSIMADTKTGYLGLNKRLSVGKGGISIFPFLDLNNNGKYDKHEPKVYGLNVRLTGGKVIYDEKDTVLRIIDMEPYTNYLLTLDETGFENISWRLKSKTLSVSVDPNQFKLIRLPISIFGEATGTIYMKKGNSIRGQGRIIISFYDKLTDKKSGSTMSESDGYFSYLGLLPGEYKVSVEKEQLAKLKMHTDPEFISIVVHAGKEGEYIDGLELIMISDHPDTEDNAIRNVPIRKTPPEIIINKEAPAATADVPSYSKLNQSEIGYRIQLFALRKQKKDETFFVELKEKISSLKIDEELLADGLYHYYSQLFTSRGDASALQRRLRDIGLKDCFITAYSGNKRDDSLLWSYKPAKGEVYYNIQMIALSRSVRINEFFSKLLSAIPDITIIETKGADGIYRYRTNPFGSLSKAQKYVQILKRAGWEDCYITVNKAE